MELGIVQGEILLLVSVVVALLSKRWKIPYTVGLLIAGVVLASTGFVPAQPLTRDLIYYIFLPPLIFEAAIFIRWDELRQNLAPVLLLATVGVLVAFGITLVGMRFLAGWEWTSAALFGALIVATDPVAVIALFKDTGVGGRLRLLVESESLLNDGTAAVLFGVVVAMVQGASFSPVGIVWQLVRTVFGGILSGLLVGGLALLLAGRTRDRLIELMVTTVAAYGSFLIAESLHLSGVLATLTTGLLLGNSGDTGCISDKGRATVEAFWEYAAFVMNSLVFLLIGIRVAHENFIAEIFPLCIALLLVIAGRAATIYPLCAVFSGTEQRIPSAHQHVLFWGGLRGALSLALVLGLPTETPGFEKISTVVFGVVGFSVVVQGLTVPLLMRRLGLVGQTETGQTAPEPVLEK